MMAHRLDTVHTIPCRALAGVAVGALFIYAALALFGLGFADLEPDEGRFGLSAINILRDPRHLAIVSQRPLGDPGSMPFMYPLTLAASIIVFGKTEFALRIVNVIAVALGAGFLAAASARLLRDQLATLVAGVAFLLNAGTVIYARSALPEAYVVAWGCAALFAAVKWFDERDVRWAAMCGVTLGVGFLVKLWLIVPFILAAGGLAVLALYTSRSPRLIGHVVVAVGCFMMTAASHLVLAWILAPEVLSHWSEIYYVFTFKSRVDGAGFDPDMWYRPWWFYLAIFFKASFFCLPFVLAGAVHLFQKRQSIAAIVIASLILPILAFSAFRVKQASYVYCSFAGMALLLALGLGSLLRSERPRAFTWCSLVAAGSSFLFFRLGVVGGAEWMAILALYAVYLTTAHAHVQRPRLATVATLTVLIVSMLLPALKMVQKTMLHRTYYREIAAHFAPALQSRQIHDSVFTAPEYPAMEFYTYRWGSYWDTFYHHEGDADFVDRLKHKPQVFFVVDTDGRFYGSRISSVKLNALRENTVDVTSTLERAVGRIFPVRVFVPINRG